MKNVAALLAITTITLLSCKKSKNEITNDLNIINSAQLKQVTVTSKLNKSTNVYDIKYNLNKQVDSILLDGKLLRTFDYFNGYYMVYSYNLTYYPKVNYHTKVVTDDKGRITRIEGNDLYNTNSDTFVSGEFQYDDSDRLITKTNYNREVDPANSKTTAYIFTISYTYEWDKNGNNSLYSFSSQGTPLGGAYYPTSGTKKNSFELTRYGQIAEPNHFSQFLNYGRTYRNNRNLQVYYDSDYSVGFNFDQYGRITKTFENIANEQINSVYTYY